MIRTLTELEAVATACMESNELGAAAYHRRAGEAANRATDPALTRPGTPAVGYAHDEEARHLLSALLCTHNERLDTAERLLVAAIIAARANGEELPARPTRVLVALEGGIIQGTVADRPGVEILQLDYDTEGVDEEDLFDIPQTNGGTAEATRCEHAPDVDPAFIDAATAARPSNPEARLAMLRREVASADARGDQGAWARDTRRELEELEAAEKLEQQLATA